jgi:hypothetical protein
MALIHYVLPHLMVKSWKNKKIDKNLYLKNKNSVLEVGIDKNGPGILGVNIFVLWNCYHGCVNGMGATSC